MPPLLRLGERAVLTRDKGGQQGTSNPQLQWMIGGQGKWTSAFDADVWHNVAYEIVSCQGAGAEESNTDTM